MTKGKSSKSSMRFRRSLRRKNDDDDDDDNDNDSSDSDEENFDYDEFLDTNDWESLHEKDKQERIKNAKNQAAGLRKMESKLLRRKEMHKKKTKYDFTIKTKKLEDYVKKLMKESSKYQKKAIKVTEQFELLRNWFEESFEE